MMITEKTAKRLADALEESTRQDRIIRAGEYLQNCMNEPNRFALSPTQRLHYKSILDGTENVWDGNYP